MKNKNIFLAASIIVLFIILVQNTQVVSMQFFFWHFSMSRIILIGFAFFAGFVSGYFFKKR